MDPTSRKGQLAYYRRFIRKEICIRSSSGYLLSHVGRNVGRAECKPHCRRQLDRSLNYFTHPRALLAAVKPLILVFIVLPHPATPSLYGGRRRNPCTRLTRRCLLHREIIILLYNGYTRQRMFNGVAQWDGMRTCLCSLTYDLVLRCELFLYLPALLRLLSSFHILHRTMLQTLRILFR